METSRDSAINTVPALTRSTYSEVNMAKIVPFPNRKSFIDMTGRRVHKWTVLGYVGCPPTTRTARWLCQCACGAQKAISGGIFAIQSRLYLP